MPQNPLGQIFARLASNFVAPVTMGNQSDLFVGQRHAGNYEAAYAGAIGLAANQAGQITTIALATTYTGLCLSNPAGSGVNLSLLRATGLLNVAPAAFTAVGLITGYSAAGVVTHTTPATVQPALIGTTSLLKGLVDTACTLVGTPLWSRWLAQTVSATGEFQFDENVNGDILIPPGGYAAIGTLIATPAAGLLASLTWEENPI